ncbi:MAG: hypothetical protein ACI4OT_00110 [Bacilli bacterium]
MKNNIYLILKLLKEKIEKLGYSSDYIDINNSNFVYVVSNYCKDILDYNIVSDVKMVPFYIEYGTMEYRGDNFFLKFGERYHNYYIYLLKNAGEDIIYNSFIFNDDNSKIEIFDCLLDKDYLEKMFLLGEDSIKKPLTDTQYLKNIFLQVHSHLERSRNERIFPDKYDRYVLEKQSKILIGVNPETKINGLVQESDYVEFFHEYMDYQKPRFNVDLTISGNENKNTIKYLNIKKYEDNNLVYNKNFEDYNESSYMYLFEEAKNEIDDKNKMKQLLKVLDTLNMDKK